MKRNVKGPAFNRTKVELPVYTGTCRHKTNRHGKECGASVSLRTWSAGPEALARCPHCGEVVPLYRAKDQA